ncbi:MAG: 1-acyl-sn-glycerol-3-phosphate acyltransferase [Chitinophagaceae bacterium]|nr:1-acyl-sn-glycerol-3-phosphate acyltransferase [Chitinophagaceae bacterium]
MLYSFVKIIARLALPIYCRDIAINKKEYLKHDGPLLLAVNHPNSFLDAIILCTLFDGTVYSLARGDAFKNKLAAKFLYLFNMFPVYRVSEGVENMDENYKTFELCKDIFKKNGIVLIFSEGRCINEWHLRPLKKGTARLAISSWEDGIDLEVLPVAINYSSFKKFGKNIKLYFGEIITKDDIDYKNSHGNAIKQFNETLRSQLGKYVFEIDSNDKATLCETFYIHQSLLKKILLFIPALTGFIVHAPLFYFTKWLGNTLIKENGHDDSKLVGFLFVFYPVFLLTLTGVVFLTTRNWLSFLALPVLPFTAWSFVQLKKQLD